MAIGPTLVPHCGFAVAAHCGFILMRQAAPGLPKIWSSLLKSSATTLVGHADSKQVCGGERYLIALSIAIVR